MKKIMKIVIIIIIVLILFFLIDYILFDGSIGFSQSNYQDIIEKYRNEEFSNNYEEDVTCFTYVEEYGKIFRNVYADVSTKCYYIEDDKLYGHYKRVDRVIFKVKNNKILKAISAVYEGGGDSFPKYIRKKAKEKEYNYRYIEYFLDKRAKEYFDADIVINLDF